MAADRASLTGWALPGGWRAATLGDLFDIQQGKALSAASRTATERHPFLRTRNVLWGELDLRTVDAMGMTDAERSKLTLAPGDLLVCEGGEIGRAAVWRGEIPDCSYQNHIHRLRPVRENVIPDFYAHWLRLAFTKLRLYEGAGTNTTIPNLSRGRLAGLVVPVPPLAEQERVARILATIRRAMTAQGHVLHATQRLRTSFLGERLLAPTDPSTKTQSSPYGPIPVSWSLYELQEICARVVDCPHTTPHFVDNGVLVIRNFNIRNGELDLSRPHFTSQAEYALRIARERPRPGDLVFSREAPVGQACIIPPGITASLGQRTMLLRPDTEIVLAEYLLGILCTPQLQSDMALKSTGVTAPHLNVADVRRLVIPVPRLAEQGELAVALVAVRKAVAQARAATAQVEGLFDSATASVLRAAA